MSLKKLINHTPAKIWVWRKNKNYIPVEFTVEAYFPDKFSISGEPKPTLDEAKKSFVEAWEQGMMENNRKQQKPLYPYWG